MADVRSLLKNERAARRVQHEHASYSTTGTLLCVVCHLQLKSETLWEGHLRSAGHIMRLQKLETGAVSDKPSEPPSKKRKANDDDDRDEGTIKKRSKPAANGLPEGFFDPDVEKETPPAVHQVEMQIPSRPATPSKPPDATPVASIPNAPEPTVDEDEWAAFEADIATAEAQVIAANEAVISAPAMSADEIKKKSAEEDYTARKERLEAEMEGDKEDAARKMEDELEEMESLEARVRRLREKREELRKKESMVGLIKVPPPTTSIEAMEEDDDEDDEEEEDWFR